MRFKKDREQDPEPPHADSESPASRRPPLRQNRRRAGPAEGEIGRPDYGTPDPRYQVYPPAYDDPYQDHDWHAGRTSPSVRGSARPIDRDSAPERRPEPEPATAYPSWSPIVVDQPIAQFEPKPPTSGYLPDTEFDGWSTEHVRLRLASVRGYSHRYYGKPRQDHAEAAVHPRTGAVIFTVADGVSSADRAELGARYACRTAMRAMSAHLDDRRLPDLTAVLSAAAHRLLAAAEQEYGRPVDPAEAEALFATTLVAGFAGPTPDGFSVSLARVGDSGAWVLDHGRFRPVLGVKDEPAAAVVSSAVHPLPRVPDPPAQAHFTLAPGQVLLVGTDGFGDPLGDGQGEVGRLFARELAEPPPARGLAHLLDFSRETFDDDRTLLALWPLDASGGVPR